MRFLLILAVLGLLFGLTATGASATVLVYLDGVVDGKVDRSGHPVVTGEDDLKTTIVSAGTIFKDRYKVGAEYGWGSIDSSTGSDDLTLWSVKGGYRFVNARAFKLDGIIAPLNIETDSLKLKGTMVGVDLAQYFSTKMFLTFTYALNNGSTFEHDTLGTDDSAALSLLRLKFHYFLNDNLGLVAGYTLLKYEAQLAGSLGKMKADMGGPAIGLVYKF